MAKWQTVLTNVCCKKFSQDCGTQSWHTMGTDVILPLTDLQKTILASLWQRIPPALSKFRNKDHYGQLY
jgi:hypothetical protein